MKTIKFALTALAGALTVSAGAQAQGGLMEPAEGTWYASLFGGASFINEDVGGVDLTAAGQEVDTGYIVGGSVGGRLPFESFGFLRTRAELEVSYQDAGVSLTNGASTGTSVDTLFVLFNTFGEIHWSDDQSVIPYFGGGLGIGVVGVNGVNNILVGGNSETRFATSNVLGLSVPTERYEFFGEGRYYRVWNVGDQDGFEGGDADGFALVAGARLKF